MNYENLWEGLKSNMRRMASIPLTNSRNMVKDVEDIAKKQTYFHILAIMEDMEKSESNKENKDKYSL